MHQAHGPRLRPWVDLKSTKPIDCVDGSSNVLCYGTITGREESRRIGEIEVCEKQSLFTVRLVSEHGTVGANDCRSRRRTGTRTVDSGKVAGVLGGTTKGGFLVEGVRWIGE